MMPCTYYVRKQYSKYSGPQPFWIRDWFLIVEDMAQGWGMLDNSGALHLLCTLLLLLLHQLNLISSGIRFQRLGILVLTACLPLYRLCIIKTFQEFYDDLNTG